MGAFEKPASASRMSAGGVLGNRLTTTLELSPYRRHGPLPVSNQYT
jgi:hypothetical protein